LPTEGKEDLSLKSTVIFFHGNGASRGLSWRVTHVLNLAKASSTVYAFDVRGYGDVDGSPTRDDVAEDARRIFDFVAEKEVRVYQAHSAVPSRRGHRLRAA